MGLGGAKLSRTTTIVIDIRSIKHNHPCQISVEESVVITKIVINIVAFLTCLVAFIGVSYGEMIIVNTVCKCKIYFFIFPLHRQEGDDDAIHHL